jgi:hypothetical protein
VGVVVGLEPVDVEQDERHAAAIAAHAGEWLRMTSAK